MNNCTVSIIVPIYNAEQYINNCITSIRNQTFTSFELILINDGSTDQSEIICKKHMSEDNRIIYKYQKNNGVSFARNAGIEIAKGKFITFVDADDVINERYLEKLMEKQIKYKLDLTACAHINIKKEQKKYCSSYFEDTYVEGKGILKTVIPKIYYNGKMQALCNPVCKLYKKEIIDLYNIRFDEEITLHEDRLFNIAYMEKYPAFFIYLSRYIIELYGKTL